MTRTTELISNDRACDTAEDMLAIQEELLVRQAGVEAARDGGDMAWLPTWYLRILAECDAVESAIKVQTKRLLTEVAARRRALACRWGEAFRKQVESDIAAAGGTKKSADYLTGRAGFRKRPEKLVITDESAFISWAKMQCPDCLEYRVARKAPAVEHLQQTGELPRGCRLEPAEEAFYPAVH